MVLEINKEMIIRAIGGANIVDYIKEALAYVEKHEIQSCIITFNGWYSLIGMKYKRDLSTYLKEFEAFCKIYN